MNVFWIAAGGALGAVSRYYVATSVFKWAGKPFPYGTLSVNLLGSFVIGMAYVWLVQNEWGSEHHKHLAMVGFLGAFTTFSTFSLESVGLLEQQRWVAAFAYISSSLVGCMSATVAGMWLARQFSQT